MKKLKLGKMNFAQLAEWMGLTSSTIYHNKEKYLKTLQEYAKFYVEKSKIIITEIFCEEFIQDSEKDILRYVNAVKASANHLTSVSGIASELREKDEQFANLSWNTACYRMTKAGNEAFGKTADEESRGRYGSRHYVWAIKIYDKPNHYRNLSYEEEKLFNTLLEGVGIHTTVEKAKQQALYLAAFEANEIDKDTYILKTKALDLTGFYEAMRQFKMRTGYQLVHATDHDFDSAF